MQLAGISGIRISTVHFRQAQNNFNFLQTTYSLVLHLHDLADCMYEG